MQIMECAQSTHIQYAVSALFCNNIFLIISGNKNITFNWVFFKLYTVFLKSKILSVYWKVLIWVYFQPFIVKIHSKGKKWKNYVIFFCIFDSLTALQRRSEQWLLCVLMQLLLKWYWNWIEIHVRPTDFSGNQRKRVFFI